MGADEVKHPELPPGFELEGEAGAPAPPPGFELEKQPHQFFKPGGSGHTLLYDFITGAQGKNAVAPTNAAQIMAAPAVADALPVAVNALRALGATTVGGAIWHAGGAMMRRMLGGGGGH